MANISETIRVAKLLGIKLTNADLDTEICAAWADRVNLAKHFFDRGCFDACQKMVDEANSYAI